MARTEYDLPRFTATFPLDDGVVVLRNTGSGMSSELSSELLLLQDRSRLFLNDFDNRRRLFSTDGNSPCRGGGGGSGIVEVGCGGRVIAEGGDFLVKKEVVDVVVVGSRPDR
jgi:hypothetical protein